MITIAISPAALAWFLNKFGIRALRLGSHFSRFSAFIPEVPLFFTVFGAVQGKATTVVARFAHKLLQFSPAPRLILINGNGVFRMFALSRCLFRCFSGLFPIPIKQRG
ncbi:hypothetical protein [Pseudomonas saponiphila]|uniref:hypothetical protein n=1 Tax=Pseudomonas saponiphila TaxID=556534 RepID=UPI001428D52C|nr:hypothetical protein [Pseudomonas saponiphila]